MKATIKSDLLIDLNGAGRNVLAYIIDNQLTSSTIIRLSKVDIVSYFEKRISVRYASTVNATRGIKDLVDKGVITPDHTDPNKERYIIDITKLSINGAC